MFTSCYRRFVCPNTLLETKRRPQRPHFTKPSENTATFDTNKKLFKKHKQRIVGDVHPGASLLSPAQGVCGYGAILL